MNDKEMNDNKISGFRSDGSYRLYPSKNTCIKCFGHKTLRINCTRCKGTGFEPQTPKGKDRTKMATEKG